MVQGKEKLAAEYIGANKFFKGMKIKIILLKHIQVKDSQDSDENRRAAPSGSTRPVRKIESWRGVAWEVEASRGDLNGQAGCSTSPRTALRSDADHDHLRGGAGLRSCVLPCYKR